MTDTRTGIDPELTLGALVNQLPGSARVLESFGLDYCCGGRQSLLDACRARGLAVDDVATELDRVGPETTPDWVAMDPSALVDHLERTHHRYLHRELPRLDALAEKVATAHGGRHPELLDVLADVKDLRDDLEPHLAKEEKVLFPMIRELCNGDAAVAFHCGTLGNPISVMLIEHDRAGALLEQLRERTDGYVVPTDGCASYRALYEGLAELEADTHLHVHKENNLLFPAVLELESAIDEHGSPASSASGSAGEVQRVGEQVADPLPRRGPQRARR